MTEVILVLELPPPLQGVGCSSKKVGKKEHAITIGGRRLRKLDVWDDRSSRGTTIFGRQTPPP